MQLTWQLKLPNDGAYDQTTLCLAPVVRVPPFEKALVETTGNDLTDYSDTSANEDNSFRNHIR